MQVNSKFNCLIFKLSKISFILTEEITCKSGLITNFINLKRPYHLAFYVGKDLVVGLMVQHREKLAELFNEPTYCVRSYIPEKVRRIFLIRKTFAIQWLSLIFRTAGYTQ